MDTKASYPALLVLVYLCFPIECAVHSLTSQIQYESQTTYVYMFESNTTLSENVQMQLNTQVIFKSKLYTNFVIYKLA